MERSGKEVIWRRGDGGDVKSRGERKGRRREEYMEERRWRRTKSRRMIGDKKVRRGRVNWGERRGEEEEEEMEDRGEERRRRGPDKEMEGRSGEREAQRKKRGRDGFL